METGQASTKLVSTLLIPVGGRSEDAASRPRVWVFSPILQRYQYPSHGVTALTMDPSTSGVLGASRCSGQLAHDL